MDLTVRPVTPGFGAEVLGVDLSQQIGDNVFQQVRQAWLDADGILLLRDQDITAEQHIDFSRRFGELSVAAGGTALSAYYLPGHPEIYRVSNKKVDGKPQGREDAGTYWHSDGSWQPAPPMASLLHALEIPPVGGDTIFANMYRAYETLSAPMKRMLEELQVVHSLGAAVLKTSYGKEYVGNIEEAMAKNATHPVIRTHPESKRKALFVNKGFTSHIVGIPQAESEAILNFLFEHSTMPENLYRHRWQRHDLVIWDNRCAMHYAVADYKAHGDRYMHRTTVKGDKSY
ncbi:MAG: taurine catabolism dioxygenase TauD, TfdA family protein [Rubritepida sp.]|nr:taurine catabolism dioxygenase TauD, TfdA family protein [Rubritepida sp.]